MKYYNQKEVGKRIRNMRIEAGIKQINLAEEMNISNDMLSRIENGKSTCAPDHLMYLCQRFGKTADYFYFGMEVENKKTKEEIIDEIKKDLRKLKKHEVMLVYRIIKIIVYEIINSN